MSTCKALVASGMPAAPRASGDSADPRGRGGGRAGQEAAGGVTEEAFMEFQTAAVGLLNAAQARAGEL